MLKILAPLGSAGLAAAAFAIAGPVTAHAAGTTGPCGFDSSNRPVQHTGTGHHSFTDSHNNCVNFVGTGNTAFLDDSDFNLINMNGNNDTVHDFQNSNHNSIHFLVGANNDTLRASNASGDRVFFEPFAQFDVVDLVGLTNDTVFIVGSHDFLIFTSACGTSGSVVFGSNLGTADSPYKFC
jgi:hypothetical protein